MSQTWLTKTISEETKIPDLVNKISVTIKPSQAIAKGDTVTIKGLTSTATNLEASTCVYTRFKIYL